MGNKLLFSAVVILLMVANMTAQGLIIGPQLGYYKAQDADHGSVMGGFALRGEFKQYFGVEASINYRQEKYADGRLTARSWPLMVTGLFYPLPFLYSGTGFGWYSTNLDYDQDQLPDIKDDKVQRLGWHFGGGLELPVSPKVRVIADYRYVLLNYPFEEIPDNEDLKSNFYVVSIGIQFFLYQPDQQ